MASQVTPWQRFVLQNVFDSQPAHRAAYLEKLGFEMNPKDTNEFRPVGSTGPFLGRVEPGFSGTIGYVKNGHVLSALSEGGNKVTDSALDISRSAVPGVIGMLMGGPPGAAALTAASLTPAGRGLTSAATEGFKNAIGDMLLDKSIPPEYGPMATKVLMDATLPSILEKGGSMASSGIKNALSSRKDAIVAMANQMSGGAITEDGLRFAANNLSKFGKNAVVGANDALNSNYRKIFGQEIPTDGTKQELLDGLQKYERSSQIPQNSLFGEAMNKWNGLAKNEVQKLSKDPNAGIKLGDALKSFNQQLAPYVDGAEPTSDDIRSAIPKIEQNKLEFINAAKKHLGVKDLSPDLMDETVPFDTVYKFSKTMKDGAYTSKGVPIDGASMIRQVAGGGDGGLGDLLTKAADNAGSDWSQIQSNRSNIKAAYNYAVDKVTPNKMMSAFIGQDSIPKQDVQKAFSVMDAALGTNMSPQIETQSFQRAFEQMLQHPRNQGSSLVLSDMIGGALKGAGYAAPAAAAVSHIGIPGGGVATVAGGALIGAANAVRPVKPEELAAKYAQRVGSLTGFDNMLSAPLTQAADVAWKQPAITKLNTSVVQPMVPKVNQMLSNFLNKNQTAQNPNFMQSHGQEDVDAINGKFSAPAKSMESSAPAPQHSQEDLDAILGSKQQ